MHVLVVSRGHEPAITRALQEAAAALVPQSLLHRSGMQARITHPINRS